MKVRPSVKPICEKCKVIKRKVSNLCPKVKKERCKLIWHVLQEWISHVKNALLSH